MLELFILVGAAGLTALVGTPVAVALARPRAWTATRERPDPEAKPAAPARRPFPPLDLGPDTMRWPSEAPWKVEALPELPWPSETWDDPQFGRHHKHDAKATDVAHEARGEERRKAQAAKRQSDEENRRKAVAAKAAGLAPSPDEIARAQVAQRQAEGRQRQQQEVLKRRAEAQKRKSNASSRGDRAGGEPVVPASVGPGPAHPEAPSLPSRAELEALIAEVGLAGTVQAIMSRTGWDFRKAAQFLARARQPGE